MTKTYLNTAFRNLRKHQLVSFIHIFGLVCSMVAFWMLTLYVLDEWSFDRYHEKAARIYRVVQHGKWNGGSFDVAVTQPPVAEALKNDFPEIEETARINPEGGGKISFENKSLDVPDILFADNSLFHIFSYQFLYGNPRTALATPNAVVLTRTLAVSVFGSAESAMDKTITIDKAPYQVQAIIEDVPHQSHFSFQALRSYPTDDNSWEDMNSFTYVLLKPGVDHEPIEASSKLFFDKYMRGYLGDLDYRMELQRLTDIHLKSNLSYELGKNGHITYVYAFAAGALLILLIAIFNYVNLATAMATKRIKETGTRRVIGAGKGHLITMFMTESILYALIASFLTGAILYYTLPFFNQFTGKHLSMFQYGYALPVFILIAFALVIGGLSGIYPALFIAQLRTLPSLKGIVESRKFTLLFRKSLVVFQFMITVIMAIASLVVYRQMQYISNKDLGFNKEQTITFHIHNSETRQHVKALKQQLLTDPLIEGVAIAGNPIGNNNIGGGDFNLGPDGKTSTDTKMVQYLGIDEDFLSTLEIDLAEGRNFDAHKPTDRSDAILVNETLVKELGWRDAVGRTVVAGLDGQGRVIKQTIVGVVKDFNTYSLQHKIAPMVLTRLQREVDQDNVYVRLSKNKVPQALQHITKIYDQFDGENKADFHFLDKNFAAQYQTEQKQGRMLLLFTILTISVACLGLFGLISFTVEQRTKEIGIRKVLGASVSNITAMLTKDFLGLVGLAFLVAAPLSWMIMSNWLNNFAYHIYLSWWIFLAAGLLVTFIALLTLCFKAVKAAMSNPIESLRIE